MLKTGLVIGIFSGKSIDETESRIIKK